MEIWKDIPDYEGLYQVSNFGRVKSLRKWNAHKKEYYERERILKNGIITKGYLAVKLFENGGRTHRVHRLVAEAFIPNPKNKPEVNHINGNKADNRVENLEWATPKENTAHSRKIGLQRPKKVVQYDLEGNFIKEWDSIKEAQEKTNSSHISMCCRGHKRYITSGGYIWKYKEVE